MTYTLQITTELFEEWGFFEARGYLPAMPGTLEDDCCWNHRNGRWEAHLTLTEAQADEFRDACEALGEAFGTCVHPLRDITDFLYDISL